MKKQVVILYFILFLLLTVLTQIGGVVYILVLIITKRKKWNRVKAVGLFLSLYVLSTAIIVPITAPIFGRVPLPIRGKLQPLTIITPLLNRHYVTPKLKQVLIEASTMQTNGYSINYLDANFPFFNGFRLLPHLSHGDGKKIDIAFQFRDQKDEPTKSARSPIGYGVHESPLPNETNYTAICRSKGAFQYDLIRFIVPKWNSNKYELDEQATKKLLRTLAQVKTSKILLEPHLKIRWGLGNVENIRFQGCHAVRHDDHIHFQIK